MAEEYQKVKVSLAEIALNEEDLVKAKHLTEAALFILKQNKEISRMREGLIEITEAAYQEFHQREIMKMAEALLTPKEKPHEVV